MLSYFLSFNNQSRFLFIIFIFFHSQLRKITKAAFDNGLGHTFVGITDAFEQGRWKYAASGDDYDQSGATAWKDYNLNAEVDHNDCAVTDGEFLWRTECDNSNLYRYAICEIQSIICWVWSFFMHIVLCRIIRIKIPVGWKVRVFLLFVYSGCNIS